MALTNAQYDEIMRGYDRRQLENRRAADMRRRLVYEKLPRLQEIDGDVASCSVQRAKLLLDGDAAAAAAAKERLSALGKERKSLLREHGYPPDYLDPIYTCPDCRDSGYQGGVKCRCFKQEIINVIYAQSNIQEILSRENFEAFSYEYYSDQDINPTTGLSALKTAENAVRECRNFIDRFDEKPKNLLFYGDTGVGKTFLSNCVARETLNQGHSVIYFTAFQLFDILSRGVFDKDTDAIAAHQSIFDSDLLVIDDLGTEMPNTFTVSQLFLCVNERILRGRSTIISTNLSIGQMTERYSERTFSRIMDNYSLIKLFTGDIRLQKRQRHI